MKTDTHRFWSSSFLFLYNYDREFFQINNKKICTCTWFNCLYLSRMDREERVCMGLRVCLMGVSNQTEEACSEKVRSDRIRIQSPWLCMTFCSVLFLWHATAEWVQKWSQL
jgi:hypothetical protein